MDEALRRYAASGALPSQRFRDLVSPGPPTIGAIKDDPTPLGTYLGILRVLLKFAQLWDTRQFNFGNILPDMADFTHQASMIYIDVYGEDTKRLPEAVVVEKVDKLRRDIIAGTHPLLVTMRLPTIGEPTRKPCINVS